MAELPTPISDQDKLLSNIAIGTPDIEDLIPNSRQEVYLKYIAMNGTQGTYESPVAIENGGTGAKTSEEARANLGINLPLPIENGGTGATTNVSALQNLGITDTSVQDFSATSVEDWTNKVINYADNKLKVGVPFNFNAGYLGQGFGSALAWQPYEKHKFLMTYNDTCGVRFFAWNNDRSIWKETTGRGVLLYDNSEGTNGTITLYDDVINYSYIEIFYRSGNYFRNSGKVEIRGTNLHLGTLTSINPTGGFMYIDCRSVKVQGTTITTENHTHAAIENGSTYSNNGNSIFITRVFGYK